MPPEDDSLPAARGSRRLVPAAVALGLLALAGWAIGTPAAFQNLWLPLASRALDGNVASEGGRFVWPLGLEADGLRVELPEVRGTVEKAALAVAPWASLRAGFPVVSRLVVQGGDLRVTANAEAPPAEESAEDAVPADEPFELPAFEIRHARVSDLQVALAAEGGTTTLGPIRLDVDDWLGTTQGRASFDLPAARRLAAGGEQTLRARGKVVLGDPPRAASQDAGAPEQAASTSPEREAPDGGSGDPVREAAVDEQGPDAAAPAAAQEPDGPADEPDASEQEPDASAHEPDASAHDRSERVPLVVELDVDVDDGEGSGVDPLALALRVRGGVGEGGESVGLDAASLSLAEGGVRRATVNASGALLPELDLELEVDADHLEPDLGSPDEGLRLRGDLAVAGSWDQPRLEPDLRLGPLPSSGETGTELALHLTGALDLLDGLRRARFEPLRVEALGADDASAGSLDLRGLVDRRGSAELRASTEAWQLLPWLRWAGMAPGEGADALTLSGTLTAKRDEAAASTADGALKLVLESRAEGETAPQAAVALLSPRLRMEAGALEASLQVRDREEAPTTLDLAAKLDRPADAEQPVRVVADLRRLDATPWAALWTAAPEEDATAEGDAEDPDPRSDAAERESSARAPEGAATAGARTSVRPWEIDVALGSLRYREVAAEGGRLDLRLGSSWEATLDEVAVGEGFVSGRAGTSERGGGQEVSWRLDVAAVDLGALHRSFAHGSPAERAGILDIATSGRGEGETLDAALGAADGRFVFGLTEGRLGGTNLFDVLVEATGMEDFGLLSFDELRGDYPIEDGTMFVDELDVDAVAVQIVITGEVRADGLDAIANPRVGPDLTAMVPGTLLDGVVGTAEDALALPLIVRVSGPWSDLSTRVEPAAPAVLGDLFTGLTDVASSLVEGAEAVGGEAQRALEGTEAVVEP